MSTTEKPTAMEGATGSDEIPVTITINVHHLESYTDAFLATAWVVAQANPAPLGDVAAVRLAERIGREIIRRWMNRQHPPLWNHQGEHIPFAARSAATEEGRAA